MTVDAEYTLRRQTEAAKHLLATLRADGAADDAELVADTVEGQTGLREAIEAALDEIDECEANEIGAKAKEEMFASRSSAFKARAERIRAMIEQALVTIDLSEPLRFAGATVSLTRRQRQPVITSEAEIPARFFVEQPRPAPKLDKKALAHALANLADGETIPGATLDNGSVVLALRRK